MTVLDCAPVRRVSDASAPVWFGLHLLLYAVLGLASLVGLAVTEGGGGRAVAGSVIAAVGWGLPLHLLALLLAAGGLMLLRVLSSLQRFAFRAAAVGVFAVQGLLMTLLIDRSETAAPVSLLAVHLVMGLLVVRPRARWADGDPSMADHR